MPRQTFQEPAQELWYPMMKLQIAKNVRFLGPGCRELMRLIRRHGSVRLACEEMEMSYSKAWRILNTLEAEAGFAVLSRKTGGKSGGETTLTPQGEDLLTRFEAYESECRAAMQAIFRRHFAKEAGITDEAD